MRHFDAGMQLREVRLRRLLGRGRGIALRRRRGLWGFERGLWDGFESEGEHVNRLKQVASEFCYREVTGLLFFPRGITLKVKEVGLKIS